MPTISQSDISVGRDAIHAIEGAYAAFEEEHRRARVSGKLTSLRPALGTLAITTALNRPTVAHVAVRLSVDVGPMLAWHVVVRDASRVLMNDPVFSELGRFQSVKDGWPAAFAALNKLLYAIGASAAGFVTPAPAENGVRPDRVALAVTLLKDHPEWSARRLASKCGCHASTLTRSELFKRAQRLAKGQHEPRRGSKDAYGTIEAVADGDD
jgi:hypothetical protein